MCGVAVTSGSNPAESMCDCLHFTLSSWMPLLIRSFKIRVYALSGSARVSLAKMDSSNDKARPPNTSREVLEDTGSRHAGNECSKKQQR